MKDLISRQAAIEAIHEDADWLAAQGSDWQVERMERDKSILKSLPSAEPEQRYTEEELRVFQHGISLSLLSKRSAQHWRYDEDTATEIEFLERLYEKVRADMRGEQMGMIEIPIERREPVMRWIPCSERLPEDIRPVIVTWKNTDPASYYQYVVGKHFTGTACYKNDKWYWYSSTTEDMLAEYGRYDSEEFDEAIECIAWMPLPEPYQPEEESE